ncbi:MAG: glucose 1-dehydrogenase [Thermoplasmatota archaeon]
MRRLEGKAGLVTGAGSGIGRATALALAREGASVMVSDIDEKSAEATAAEILASKGTARSLRCDVTRSADVGALVSATTDAFGKLDFAHNNAGWEGPIAKIANVEEADFDRVIAINLKGVFLCLKHEIPVMAAAGRGAIVNTASVAGLVANAGASPYAAAKHGVVGLTKTAAAEYARKGVRVNAICPGWTDTPMSRRAGESNPKIMQNYLAGVPANRLGAPEEIAALVCYLVSDEASYINGAALPIDGGWTAQ